MNTEQSVKRDERTVAVENASFRWAFNFITFALLIDASYRARVRKEVAWDLFALVAVSGAISIVYLVRHKVTVLSWSSLKRLLIIFAGIIVVAVILFILFIRLFLP